jgi:adenine-specific DNA-methyltransferase
MNQDLTTLLKEKTRQIQSLQTQNLLLKTKLESLLEGGGIKIFFPDKLIAKQIIRKVNPRILKELPRYSLNPINSPNLILEGDNLHALASLYQFRNKTDLILTDPPYNTGKDFRYNDKQNKLPNDEELGDLIKTDDPAKHTKWMKFMLPRLILMRSMLKDTGILAICVDYRELFNLGKLLDEVFGSENLISIINWEKATVKNDSRHVSNVSEYVLVYAKNKTLTTTQLLPRSLRLDQRYKNPDQDPKGAWVADNPCAKTPSRTLVYGIQNPFTGKIVYPPAASGWRLGIRTMKPLLEEWGSEYIEKDLNDGYVPGLVLKNNDLKKAQQNAQTILHSGQPWPKLVFRKNGLGKPGIKRYLADIKKGSVATTYWKLNEIETSLSWKARETGLSQTATREIIARIGSKGRFDGIKPLKLFQKILQIWCPPNGLVLDPFAGAGTTAEAILQLNQTQKTNRSFILIEQGNPKNGDNFTKTLLVPRLKATITGQWADNKPHEPLPGSFKFLKLTKQINSQTLLEMEREDLTEAILSTHLDSTLFPNNTYLIAKNSQNEGIFLIWNGNPRRESKLSEKTYRQCLLERKTHQLSPTCHIYARTSVYSPSSVIFHKIPDHLLSDFGISPEFALKKTP